MPAPPAGLRTYGRVKSRSLKPRQARLMDTLLPALALPQGPIDPRELMPEARDVWLEAGFGAGEHLADLALDPLAKATPRFALSRFRTTDR